MDKRWIYKQYLIFALLLIGLSFASDNIFYIRYTNYTALSNGTILIDEVNPDTMMSYAANISNGTAFLNNTSLYGTYLIKVYDSFGNELYNSDAFIDEVTYIYIPNNEEYTFTNILTNAVAFMFNRNYFVLINGAIIIVAVYVYNIQGLIYGPVITTLFLMILASLNISVDKVDFYLLVNAVAFAVGIVANMFVLKKKR